MTLILHWLNSLPTIVYWLIIGFIVFIGMGVVSIFLMWSSGENVDFFTKADVQETGCIRFTFFLLVCLGILGAISTGFIALLSAPVFLLQRFLDWPLERAVPVGVITAVALIIFGCVVYSWIEGKSSKHQ